MIIRSTLLRFGTRPQNGLQAKNLLLSRQLAYPAIGQARSHWSDRLPAIIRPSFWGPLYPGVARWFREKAFNRQFWKSERKKEWNPATFFIWMAMLIGSQSINLILLKNEWIVFSRQADAKIALLKDVLKRVQNGEDVDVEKELGTGQDVAEREWRDVVNELEHEDRLWEKKARRRLKRKQQAEEKAAQERTLQQGEEPPKT